MLRLFLFLRSVLTVCVGDVDVGDIVGFLVREVNSCEKDFSDVFREGCRKLEFNECDFVFDEV
jgi:hypothetical protein